ncbi:MAG: triacylglycerol lipase [Lachnospiraceae bacterium]|nr:triacylglycerol lipase [Lachnospiraceae bacterium]
MKQQSENKNDKPYTELRLNVLAVGCVLLILFLISTVAYSARLIATMAGNGFADTLKSDWPQILLAVILESILFWIGIIAVYVTSVQLGIRLRIIGIICGWIPVINIIVLLVIIKVSVSEAVFEKHKYKINKKRAGDKVCETKYPILMVHGVFFRDFKYLNYWGRIPDELIKNGATVYYGQHQSAASVENSAHELADRINEIVSTTGCEKINVIAHSKGGLDIKTAIVKQGIADKVASVVTVNTPHRGCEFAEYLLNKAPESFRQKVALAYNNTLRKLGDPDPDFIAAVTDLTASGCKIIWDETADYDYKGHGIYTRSIGSCMKKAGSGAFPLNMSYHLVKMFDGRNDGLVGEASFKWGEDYQFLENKRTRGISHGDMIDLNRENIPGFDVREFYVSLVSDLKVRGL